MVKNTGFIFVLGGKGGWRREAAKPTTNKQQRTTNNKSALNPQFTKTISGRVQQKAFLERNKRASSQAYGSVFILYIFCLEYHIP